MNSYLQFVTGHIIIVIIIVQDVKYKVLGKKYIKPLKPNH